MWLDDDIFVNLSEYYKYIICNLNGVFRIKAVTRLGKEDMLPYSFDKKEEAKQLIEKLIKQKGC